jgi:hypothetical protein
MAERDIDRSLQALDAIEAPDLWGRARATAPRSTDAPPLGSGRWISVVLAAVISIASLALLVAAFDRPEPHHGVSGASLDPSALRSSWTADIGDAVTNFGVVQDAQRVYVPTTTGILAFSKTCSDPCEPAWRADLVEGSEEALPFGVDVQIVAQDGLVAATYDGDLAVFPADCRTDGGACDPMWRAEHEPGTNGYRDPVIADGIVKTTSSRGEMPEHQVTAVAFEARCRTDGGICEPVWTGDLGVGTAYFPSATVGSVFYQQVGPQMLGFDAHCRSDGGLCDADFRIPALGDQRTQAGSLYGPVGRDGVLAVVSGDGNVYAYPEHCGAGCRPLWKGPADDYLEGFPFLAGDQVVVATGDGVVAFPLACRTDGGRCEPRWQVALGAYPPIAHADENVVITASHSSGEGPGVVAMDPTCEGDCHPVWSGSVGGRVYGVASDGATVFAAVGDEVVAYPVDCSDPCSPVWRSDVLGEAWWLLIDGTRLIVASRAGGPGEVGLTLHVFATAA